MSLCFYINSHCYTPSFMVSLLMGTQIGGMDLRPWNKATERPVRYMFRSRGFLWISCEITRTNFVNLPIWDSNSSSFSCRSFSSQREPTVVGSIKGYLVWAWGLGWDGVRGCEGQDFTRVQVQFIMRVKPRHIRLKNNYNKTLLILAHER